VYDITRRESFSHLGRWLQEAQMYASKDIVITLVGNKSDLDHKRVVQSSEGQEFAKEHDLLFVEASAKTAEGVEEAFMRTAQMVHAKLISGRLTGAEVSDRISVYMCAYIYPCGA
jgi:Ras-related protein Rab-2A